MSGTSSETNGDSVENTSDALDAMGGPDGSEVRVDLDRDLIYMAIVTSDSTVVYYKLAKGIRKPADIPDE